MAAGTYGSASEAIITEFIPASGGDTIIWNNGFSSTKSDYCLCAFDSNKTYITGQYWTCNSVPSRTLTLTANDNIAYIVATCSATASAPSVSVNGEVMWVKQETSKGIDQGFEEDEMRLASIEKTLLKTMSPVSVANGTTANTGNENVIRTQKFAVTPGKTYRLYTTRPADNGYFYDYGYATYSSMEGAINANKVRTLVLNSSSPNLDTTITINPGEVGLAYEMGMIVNGETTRRPIRATDFAGYTVAIEEVSTISQISEKGNSVIESLKTLNLSNEWEAITLEFDRLGSGGSSFPGESSSSMCFTKAIAAKAGDYFKGYWSCNSRSNGHSAVYKTNSTNTTGVSPLVEVGSSGKQWVEFKVEEDCYITLQINSTTISSDSVLYVKHENPIAINNNSPKEVSYQFQKQFGVHRVQHWKNGTHGNKGNSSFIHCDSYDIPNGVSKLLFLTSRPAAENCEYRLALRFINASGSSVSPVDASADTVISKPISVPSGAKRFYLSVGQYNTTLSSYVALRYTDMRGYDSWICDYVPGSLAYMQQESKSNDGQSIVSLNQERAIQLAATCRQNKNTTSPYHDYQLLITSDEHNDTVSGERAVEAANGFGTINAYVNCGDIVTSYFKISEVEAFQQRFSNLSKPGYVVAGNHDVGNTYYVGVSATHSQVYDAFIKPMVEANYLANGEYTTDIPYWYHDDSTNKVRLIGLYEYDDPLDLATNTYWEAVTYDSTKPKLTFSTEYAVDDIVNCGNYTTYSFKCISAVTTPANYYTDTEKIPTYRCYRGKRLIRETQANWYLNTLASTPEDYGVIVLLHQPISNSVEYVNSKFTQKGVPATNIQTMMETDFIIEALTAFANGERYTKNIVMNNEAVYMNTQGSGSSAYAYAVDKDFSLKNSGTYVLGVIGGHRHKDMIYKMNGIYQIDVVCASTDRSQAAGSDIRRTIDSTIARDSLTIASFAEGRIGLCKIGVNVTMDGTARDYEVINTTTDNEE